MKNKDIKAMSKEELLDRIKIEIDALKTLKVSHQLTNIENPLQIRFNRRLIAKLKTEVRAKEILEKINN